jgi:hypothetical protein
MPARIGTLSTEAFRIGGGAAEALALDGRFGVALDLVESVDAVEQVLGDGVALLGRDDAIAPAMRPAAQSHDASVFGDPVIGPVAVRHPVGEAPPQRGTCTGIIVWALIVDGEPQDPAQFLPTATADVEEGLVAAHPCPQRSPSI